MDIASNSQRLAASLNNYPNPCDPEDNWSSQHNNNSNNNDKSTSNFVRELQQRNVVFDNEAQFDLYYGILTTYVLPAALLIQWALEIEEAMHRHEWLVPTVAVLLFTRLSDPYRQYVLRNSSPLEKLFPVVSLLLADLLLLLHKRTAAAFVMVICLAVMGALVYTYKPAIRFVRGNAYAHPETTGL
jgi:hypothetical protein